mmetsp:Transcript_2052/g.3129  ORF Transcript_2052/g.3129 Transcript_2052/m.3129 type:complete len:240 (-) Transcript_2052:672-1391(-)
MKRLLRSEVCSLDLEAFLGVRKDLQGLITRTVNMEADVHSIKLGVKEIETILPAMFMALMAQRDDETPALFVLMPRDKKGLVEHCNIWSDFFEMQFLCEYHNGAHLVTNDHDHRGVKFISLQVRNALVHIRPYFKFLKPLLTLGASALQHAPVPEVDTVIGVFEMLLGALDQTIDEAGGQDDIQNVDLSKTNNAQASSAAQCALQILLDRHPDPKKAWPYLEERIHWETKRTRWLCLEH